MGQRSEINIEEMIPTNTQLLHINTLTLTQYLTLASDLDINIVYMLFILEMQTECKTENKNTIQKKILSKKHCEINVNKKNRIIFSYYIKSKIIFLIIRFFRYVY